MRPLPPLLLALLLFVTAHGQEANGPTAGLTVNGLSGDRPPYALGLPEGVGIDLELRSGNAPRAFLLAIGPLDPAHLVLPGAGRLDLELSSPRFLLLADGLFGLPGTVPAFNALARTDANGGFALALSGLGGPTPPAPFAFQALVEDPSAVGGLALTAATELRPLAAPRGPALSPGADGVVTHAFTSGFRFPFYGQVHDRVHVAENGLLGFDRTPGTGRAELERANRSLPSFFAPATVAATRLGTNGVPCPPSIGLFEDLDLQAGGALEVEETATRCTFIWREVPVRGSSSTTSFRVVLHGRGAAAPGRIDLHMDRVTRRTPGRGRVLGISPGGDGVNSRAPTPGSRDLSALAHATDPSGAVVGTALGGPLAAGLESFDLSWARDPVNPDLDLRGETLSFLSPASGGYRLRSDQARRLAVTGVSPDADLLSGGRRVRVQGADFADDGSLAVRFGGTPATGLTVLDAETLEVTVPPRSTAGPVDLTVTRGSRGTSATLASGFRYATNTLTTTLPLRDEEVVTHRFDPALFSDFDLFGRTHTAVHVHANGLVAFGSQPPNQILYASDPVSWDGLGFTVLAPLWNDLCGSAAICGVNGASVELVETRDTLTIRWRDFAQWPAWNQGLSFEVVLDRGLYGSGTRRSRITYDWSALTATPSPVYNQPGGRTGLVVGMKGPQPTSTVSPSDLTALGGSGLGIPGAPVSGANLIHWIPGPATTSTVPPSRAVNDWPFGTAATPGARGQRALRFEATDASNATFRITLL